MTTRTLDKQETILVIKLGAYGDFVLVFGGFAEIRRQHPHAKLILLTGPLYAELARQSPWFDEVWVDKRAKIWKLSESWRIFKLLRSCHFDRVYDLQNNNRTSLYFKIIHKPVEWSGKIKGCSHCYDDPNPTGMHIVDRLNAQLALMGFTMDSCPDLSWMETDLSRFSLPKSYGLLCPGASAHRSVKRWPTEFFAEVAKDLVAQGITPVLVGTKIETEAAKVIQAVCPQAISILDQTSFLDLYSLGKGAKLALGNDSGPLHMFALTGCPCLALFSGDSVPKLSAPRPYSHPERVQILQEANLADLSPEKVIATLRKLA